MQTFTALVVDNDPAIREIALEANDPRAGVEVLVAASLEEARDVIARRFLHVAVVDMQLTEGHVLNVDGQTLLGELMTLRPSCRRLLLTAYPDTYREQLFALLDPDDTVIHGAVDKGDFKHLFTDYVRHAAERWLSGPVDVPDAARLHDLLAARKIRGAEAGGRQVQLTPDEVEYVVSSLLGQGDGHEPDEDSVESLSLRLLEGGKSRSIVATGRPRSVSGASGLACVIKIGPREDTAEEVRRYGRHVRFRVGLHRRVEVLGVALADTIGGVCYSLADDGQDLQSLLDAEDDRASSTIKSLFDPDDGWGADLTPARDQAGYFHTAYGLDALRVGRAVRQFAEKHAGLAGGRLDGDRIVLDGAAVSLPTTEDLGAGRLRGGYQAAVAHGDLNASNVIVTEDGRIALIDFRHTARAPAAIDFAAMQASLRLAPHAYADLPARAAAIATAERRLWAESGQRPNDAATYWEAVSSQLLDLADRRLGEVPVDERAATTLLYALRVFRVTSLPREARMRLLLWISALLAALR